MQIWAPHESNHVDSSTNLDGFTADLYIPGMFAILAAMIKVTSTKLAECF